jgi:hypothetical protein
LRRAYHSPWYTPDMHDFDAEGHRFPDKYDHSSISSDYLNKYFTKDFEQALSRAGVAWKTHAVPFSSRFARWTAHSSACLGCATPFLATFGFC